MTILHIINDIIILNLLCHRNIIHPGWWSFVSRLEFRRGRYLLGITTRLNSHVPEGTSRKSVFNE